MLFSILPVCPTEAFAVSRVWHVRVQQCAAAARLSMTGSVLCWSAVGSSCQLSPLQNSGRLWWPWPSNRSNLWKKAWMSEWILKKCLGPAYDPWSWLQLLDIEKKKSLIVFCAVLSTVYEFTGNYSVCVYFEYREQMPRCALWPRLD